MLIATITTFIASAIKVAFTVKSINASNVTRHSTIAASFTIEFIVISLVMAFFANLVGIS